MAKRKKLKMKDIGKAVIGGGIGLGGNLKGLNKNLSKIAKSAKVAPKKKSKPSLSTFKKSSGLSKKKKKR